MMRFEQIFHDRDLVGALAVVGGSALHQLIMAM